MEKVSQIKRIRIIKIKNNSKAYSGTASAVDLNDIGQLIIVSDNEKTILDVFNLLNIDADKKAFKRVAIINSDNVLESDNE